MRQSRRQKKYSIEFKLEAVRLVETSDRPVSHIAEELDVPGTTLEDWLKRYGATTPVKSNAKASVVNSMNDGEMERLRRENAQLRMERDFLKKAAAFFANDKS